MSRLRTEPQPLPEDHQRVQNAREIMAEVTAGSFTYLPDLTRRFVTDVTRVPERDFPDDAKEEHFDAFAGQLLVAQLVVARPKRFPGAKRDALAAHLLMQGNSPLKVTSTILGISETKLAGNNGEISRYTKEVNRRIANGFRSIYTLDGFRVMFDKIIAGEPNPVPFMPLPHVNRFKTIT